jgi:hypothetical protein
VSNLKDMIPSSGKEISFLEIILNFWKYKFYFIFILIFSLTATLVIENLVQKKATYEMELKHPDVINNMVYPSKFLSMDQVIDVASIPLGVINTYQEGMRVNYFFHYFEDYLISKKNLINFAKISDKKYNLKEYIIKKNIKIIRDNTIIVDPALSGGKLLKYSIILPYNEINKDFIYDYFTYIANISSKKFKIDTINMEKNKFKLMQRDMSIIDNLIKYSQSNNIEINNLNTIEIYKAHHKIREIKTKEHISYIENIKINFSNEWIAEQQEPEVVNYKIYKILTYIIPLIFSLIVFMIFVLIRLTRQDQKIDIKEI